MKIKIANTIHVEGIIEVWEEFIDYHSQIDPFFARKDDNNERFTAYIQNQLLSSKSLVLVGLEEDKVIGFGLAQIRSYPPIFQQTTYGYISDLAVKLDFMRNGIGDLLLGGMLKWFKSKHIERVELQVLAHNKLGSTFWKKFGFEEYKYVMKIEFCDKVEIEK
ncbi:MAG: GNAT family N-acetyltransferase [Spirochaetales bacterium]|nr:GNAT family N-acetyltransferase [Spirochaetales bacterium]